jgi:hypothetical protein
MTLLQDDLELLLKEFNVKNLGELFTVRTTKPIDKAAVQIESPKRVQMTAAQCERMCEKIGLRYLPGYENRVIERITTTEAPDRYGDIVRAKGIDNENYRKNPVVLFAHDSGDLPVGMSLKEWIDGAIKGWRSWDLYLGDEVDPSGRAEITFRFIDSGAMPAGSIGFMPRETKIDHSPEERSKLGLGRFGVEYITCEKLEHSACSVPANPEALSNRLKSIESTKLKTMFSLAEVDRMAAAKMLDDELLDVFASALGVRRTVSLSPAPPAVVEKEMPAININLDMKVISDLTEKLATINTDLTALSKVNEQRFNDLMAATQRALTALENRTKSASLYDRKEIEGVLKL